MSQRRHLQPSSEQGWGGEEGPWDPPGSAATLSPEKAGGASVIREVWSVSVFRRHHVDTREPGTEPQTWPRLAPFPEAPAPGLWASLSLSVKWRCSFSCLSFPLGVGPVSR